MLKNYLIVAFRSIKRHKVYSIINIIGLAIGMTACLLLFLWVRDELSYDRYHDNASRIYRATSQGESDGNVDHFVMTPAPLGPALVNEFPEIEKAVRFGENEFLVSYQNKLFHEYIFFSDPEVFDVFTFPLVEGNPNTALSEPHSILISEDIRDKYFAEENPIGKMITLNERWDYRITGVFKNIPHNSHFRFNFLGCFSNYASSHFDQWGISNYYTYILVSKDFSVKEFENKIPQFVEKYRGKKSRYYYKVTYPVQPLTQIHLHSNLRGEIEPNTDISIVYIFCVIAFFILMIACLNYINLSTAKYTTRTKEVALRKIYGASRPQLIKQFLGESFLITLISLPLAVVLAELFLPLFNSLTLKELEISYFNNIFLLLGLVGIVICVGFLAGILPAFYISTLKPIQGLKGVFQVGIKATLLRRSLVVFQFAISIIFIISTIIISNQLDYIRNRRLGLNKENVISIPIYSKEAMEKREILKHEFLQDPHVIAVSASSFFPGKNIWYQNYWREDLNEDTHEMINWISVDHDFIETMQLKLVEGRNFSIDFPSDAERAYILNESAVKEFGWIFPLGKKFKIIGTGAVIGVVEDFNFKSLHQEIRPCALYIYPNAFTHFLVRILPDNISQTLQFLQKKWQELIPSQTFEYSFLDEDFDNLYRAELRLGKIFIIIASLAIFVACMGLYGMSLFTAEQRRKEIGIRKVLGSTNLKIVYLISKEYIRLVLIASIIAWPIAYYAMHRWLQGFAYKANIGIATFLLSAALAFFIALATISYQSIKTALTNPVESLRYE